MVGEVAAAAQRRCRLRQRQSRAETIVRDLVSSGPATAARADCRPHSPRRPKSSSRAAPCSGACSFEGRFAFDVVRTILQWPPERRRTSTSCRSSRAHGRRMSTRLRSPCHRDARPASLRRHEERTLPKSARARRLMAVCRARRRAWSPRPRTVLAADAPYRWSPRDEARWVGGHRDGAEAMSPPTTTVASGNPSCATSSAAHQRPQRERAGARIVCGGPGGPSAHWLRNGVHLTTLGQLNLHLLHPPVRAPHECIQQSLFHMIRIPRCHSF